MTEIDLIASFKIQSTPDRSSMVAILTKAGYIVTERVVPVKYYSHEYYVDVYKWREE